MSALRVCIECGLAALDVDDFEMFVKASRGKYGRRNLCKECYKKIQRSYRNIHKEQIKHYRRRHYLKHREETRQRDSKKNRLWRLKHREELLLKRQRDRDEKRTWFWQKKIELVAAKGEMPLTCWYCGKLITKIEGHDPEALVFHSVDGNHENWDLENKVPVHRGCHSTLHTKDRKGVTAEERRVMINEEAKVLFRRGVKPGDISGWLVNQTGLSYTTIWRYLDPKYKHPSFRKGGTLYEVHYLWGRCSGF